jgi:ribosomal protein S18 acetylase RimI-like enzyme
MSQHPELTTRPVQPGDEAFVLEAYASGRSAELALVPWGQEQKQAFVKMQLSAQLAHYAAYFPAAEHLLLLLEGQPAGRIYIERSPEKIHILDLTLMPALRGRGLGARLLRRLQAEAGDRPLSIYVETFNPSLSLFERLGFRKINEDPINFLMEWRAACSGKDL